MKLGLHGKHCDVYVKDLGRICDRPATVCNGGRYRCDEHDPLVDRAFTRREIHAAIYQTRLDTARECALIAQECSYDAAADIRRKFQLKEPQ